MRDELASGDLAEIAQLPGLKETFYAITLVRRFANPVLRSLLGDMEPAGAAATGSAA